MPRTGWSLLILVVLALPLASCIHGESSCPTCPPGRSASIVIHVGPHLVNPNLGLDIDSVHVALDGGPVQTLRRGQTGRFDNLARGTHAMSAVVFHVSTGSTSSEVDIVLERGETRTVIFHHDFPMVVVAPPPAASADVIVAAAATAVRREVG